MARQGPHLVKEVDRQDLLNLDLALDQVVAHVRIHVQHRVARQENSAAKERAAVCHHHPRLLPRHRKVEEHPNELPIRLKRPTKRSEVENLFTHRRI